MTVVHVVDCLRTGGTERQLVELVRIQVRRGLLVRVACLRKEGEMLADLVSLGCEPVEFRPGPSLASPATALKVAAMARWMRKERAEVVHTHDFYAGAMGVAAARLAGMKVVLSRKDLGHWLGPSQRLVLRLLHRLAHRTVANSRAALSAAGRREGLPEGKGVVIPNGLDLAAFDRAAARPPSPPLDLDPGARAVSLVANMRNPVKGQSTFLEGAALLAPRFPDVRFLLVGDGPLLPRYQERARDLGVSGRVLFLGARSDVPSLLGRVAVATLTSEAEGMPNAVLEAMAAGRPVVSTAVGGAVELVREGVNGFLVPPRDPGRLAERVGRLLADPHLAETMGRKGRALVEGHYTSERMADRFEELYEEVLHLPGKGADG